MRFLPRLAALAAVLLAVPARAQVPTPAEEARWDRAFDSPTPVSGGYGAAEYPDGRILLVGYSGTVQSGAAFAWTGDRWSALPALAASGSFEFTIVSTTPVVTDDGRAFVAVAATNRVGWTINEWTGTQRIPQPGLTGAAGMRLFRGPQGRACVVGVFDNERVGRVLCLTGAAWTPLGGPTGDQQTIADAAMAPDGRLYVTGNFTSLGGTPAIGVAVWDGSAWSAVGDGSQRGSLRAGFRVAVSGAGRVLVATLEGNGTSTPIRYRLWAFDAGTWTETPTTSSYNGRALSAGPGGEVFTVDASGASVALMRADGRTLTVARSGRSSTGGTVFDFSRARNGDLLVSGSELGFGSLAASGVVRYDGTQFRAYGDGLRGEGIYNFNAMAPRGAGVCVAGDIEAAGGLVQRGRSPYGVACWSGARWDTLATPIPNGARGAEPFGLVSDPAGRLYTSTAVVQNGVTQGAGVFRYDAGAWTRLGGLFQSGVQLAISADGGALYVFGRPAGSSAIAVQRWTGSAWVDVGAINAQLATSLAVTGDGTVWAAGAIPIDGQTARLARFDGTAWRAAPVPAGTPLALFGWPILAGPGSSLIVPDVQYYDARFQVAFDAKVARLDGTTWTKLGTAPFRNLRALAQDGRGNVFASATGPSGEGFSPKTVYRYDAGADTWTRITTGFGGDEPSTMLYTNGALYAAGNLRTVGTTPSQGFARWSDPLAVAAEGAPRVPGTAALRVFPNPARGRATAVFTLGAPQTVRATLVDVSGREVALVYAGALPYGEVRLGVPLAGLAPGVYVLRVEGPSVRTARAFVVTR